MENTQIEGSESAKPHKTWFIETGDGMVFAARETEAWSLLKNRTNWMRQDFKIIGVSDGLTYHKVLREGRKAIPILQKEIDQIQKDLTSYSDTEHRLKFVDLIDENDERFTKVKKLKKELVDKLTVKLKEMNEITVNLDKKAFDAELAVARGHIEMPSNQDIITPGGRRDEILKNMAQ